MDDNQRCETCTHWKMDDYPNGSCPKISPSWGNRVLKTRSEGRDCSQYMTMEEDDPRIEEREDARNVYDAIKIIGG